MANRCMDGWNMEVTYFYCMKGQKGTIVKCKLNPGQKQLQTQYWLLANICMDTC